MNILGELCPSRRGFLTGGALVLGFSLLRPGELWAQQEGQNVGAEPRKPLPLPGSLQDTPLLDSWIRIGADGSVTVFTGKAELGQGIKTALIQVAEQLCVEPRSIELVTADTTRTPNEGYTAGSHSMQDSGTALMHAAAQVREILVAAAARRLGVPADRLKAENGSIVAEDGRKIGFGALVGEVNLHEDAKPQSKLKDPARSTVMGRPMQRVDIPAKVTGGVAYVHDLRLPGMVHARAVRPPRYDARLTAVDLEAVQRLPGVLKVVRSGSYLAVVASGEYKAIAAMRALTHAARWEGGRELPDPGDLHGFLQRLPSKDSVILDRHEGSGTGIRMVEATFRRAYQMHGSIGPSCAVAVFQDNRLRVWTHSQGVYPLRQAIAEMLKLVPDKVECVHMEGAGCYGHNAADDAAADAALIATAVPGRPVRLQLMREQENVWEPYGPAMVTNANAMLDGSGRIADWGYEVWSNPHNTRPAPAGNLLAAQYLDPPFAPPAPKPIPPPEGGGDRNAIPRYVLPNAHVVHHFIPAMPLRVSALRGLGAYMNVFSIESFMDELAKTAATDPVEFRLRHLDDPRARDVITLAAERFGWRQGRPAGGTRGRGIGFARYKNLGAYAAVAVEVDVDRESGRVRLVRAVAASDSGQAVNPDGIRNQIEGGIIQSASWTLYEYVTFDRKRITSTDWSSYPILRFAAVPERVEVHVIDRPGQPFLGTGEAAQGPTSAAIANAVADAIGVRIYDLPLTQERVKAAIGV